MAWLKTYSSGTEVGRINSDQILAFDIAQDNSPDPGHGFGVSVSMAAGARMVTCGYPYATAAEAVAAIDGIIINSD